MIIFYDTIYLLVGAICMNYNLEKMSTFIKINRLEISMTQRDFSNKIYVSHELIDSIENAKLHSLDQHINNIFNCFELDYSKYTDQDEDWVERIYQIIHQIIYFELLIENEVTLR